jgi:hypothetical protein
MTDLLRMIISLVSLYAEESDSFDEEWEDGKETVLVHPTITKYFKLFFLINNRNILLLIL